MDCGSVLVEVLCLSRHAAHFGHPVQSLGIVGVDSQDCFKALLGRPNIPMLDNDEKGGKTPSALRPE